MRRLLALMLVVALPVLLVADQRKTDTKANTLTPQQVRDGWLLLFDGETTFGWKKDGETEVKEGALVLGGSTASKASVTTTLPCGFELRFEMLPEGTEHLGVRVRVEGGGGGIASRYPFRGSDTKTWKEVAVRFTSNPAGYKLEGIGEAGGVVKGGGPTDERRATTISFPVPAQNKLSLRNVRLRPLGSSALFNGKDLDGWKVFEGKGKKSKYTVTKEGWLNVKDGPGDLQTTKLFGNFVLQLECISNGDRLNSGIFFRCIPGQYQQGYEAQIHNGWTETPQKTYTIDDYDPKTHKLLGKKKVQSKAMDYGTGAIYRRMPARFGVAKDGEWFTMTVAAYDRHIATWVNGIQVVDWTDNRPESENARNGYRPAAGAISIQGHDPTTDLSFRNIRIAELPRVKK
jgi:hypothetical protein